MNVWVAIARGIKTEPHRYQRLVTDLAELVASGKVTVPLSCAHYLELWHRGSQKSREDVGAVMRDVSRYATFAPLPSIRKLEVEAFVARFMGRDEHVGPSSVLGTGASHAFDSRFGRFRFVESLASPDGSVPEGPAVAAPDELANEELAGPGWEWLQLVGDAEIVANPGIEHTPEHRLGSEWRSEELQLRQLLRDEAWARARLRDLLITDEITSLTSVINQACWDARIQPHSLFLENPQFSTPPEAMQHFVLGLPSVDVLVSLREWKHRDLNHPWDQHDRTDLHALASVIPYADAVVTERRWAHLADASGLSERYGTKVRGISDLESLTDELLDDH